MSFSDYLSSFGVGLTTSLAVQGLAVLFLRAKIKDLFTKQDRKLDDEIGKERDIFKEALAKERATFELTLNKELQAFSARNNIFVQQQAEVVKELYSKIWTLTESISELGSITKEEEGKAAMTTVKGHWNDCRGYYFRNVIFFNEEEEKAINLLLVTQFEQASKYGAGIILQFRGPEAIAHLEAVNELNRDARAAQDALRKRFRSLLQGKSV